MFYCLPFVRKTRTFRSSEKSQKLLCNPCIRSDYVHKLYFESSKFPIDTLRDKREKLRKFREFIDLLENQL